MTEKQQPQAPRIKDSNYITICGWMLNRLNLSGRELQVYAIIYGFTQDGETEFNGSLNYIAAWLGTTSRHTVIRAIESLEAKGFIKVKRTTAENGSPRNYYTAITQPQPCAETAPPQCQNDTDLSAKTAQPQCQNSTAPCAETAHNIYINNNTNKDINNILPTPAKIKPKPIKHKTGEYNNVLLTDQEMEKLKLEFPRDYKSRIDDLSRYMKSTGKKYIDHLATIRNWARRDKANQAAKNKKYCMPETEASSEQDQEIAKLFGIN